MELERSLSSIQWKYLRSILVATSGSTFLFLCLFSIFWLVVYFWNENTDGFYQIFGYEPDLDQFVHTLLIIGILSIAASLIVGTIIGFYFGRKMKKTLQALSWAAEKLTRGELDYRIRIDGSEEIAELSEQFNLMASRIENQVISMQRLIQKNAELSQQASQLAVHEERQRLARELHDSISQQIFAIMMSLAAISRLLEKDPERAKKQFAMTEEMAATAQAEMRALLLHLRPIQLEGKRLELALVELLSDLKSKHPIQYEWEIDSLDELPSGFEDHLFRIVQEGLSNALRHSRGKRIRVVLRKRKSMILLTISDDGIGMKMDPERLSSSLGLRNIRERVNEMGGTFEISSKEGKGVTLTVQIPMLLKEGETNE